MLRQECDRKCEGCSGFLALRVVHHTCLTFPRFPSAGMTERVKLPGFLIRRTPSTRRRPIPCGACGNTRDPRGDDRRNRWRPSQRPLQRLGWVQGLKWIVGRTLLLAARCACTGRAAEAFQSLSGVSDLRGAETFRVRFSTRTNTKHTRWQIAPRP